MSRKHFKSPIQHSEGVKSDHIQYNLGETITGKWGLRKVEQNPTGGNQEAQNAALYWVETNCKPSSVLFIVIGNSCLRKWRTSWDRGKPLSDVTRRKCSLCLFFLTVFTPLFSPSPILPLLLSPPPFLFLFLSQDPYLSKKEKLTITMQK